MDEFPEPDDSEEVACFGACRREGNAFLPLREGMMVLSLEQREQVAQAAAAARIMGAHITE